jgi:hypothetical protein
MRPPLFYSDTSLSEADRGPNSSFNRKHHARFIPNSQRFVPIIHIPSTDLDYQQLSPY